MTKSANPKNVGRPKTPEDQPASERGLRVQYLAFIQALAREVARRDHDAETESRDTSPTERPD